MNKRLLAILVCISFFMIGILMLSLALFPLHFSDTASIPQPNNSETTDTSVDTDNLSVIFSPSASSPCSSHIWEEGTCTVCGNICSHPEHDPEAQLCSVCRKKVCHQYRNLICSCGKKLQMEELYIEPSLFYPSAKFGHIETIEYETPNYSDSRNLYTKKMDVYLPFGYSNEKKYNVVLMLPGTGSDYTYWFETDHYYKYPDDTVIDINLCNLLDNMIENCICEPFIAVSLTYYIDDNERSSADDYDCISAQLSQELKYNILPAIISRYNTYAEGTDFSSISAAREHFGFIGASAGSILGIRSALMENLAVFGWFGFLSGCQTPSYSLVSTLQNGQNSDYSICGFYAASGITDPLREGTYNAYKALYSSGLITEKNSFYNDIRSASHEDRVWVTGIFNCLQLFFSK